MYLAFVVIAIFQASSICTKSFTTKLFIGVHIEMSLARDKSLSVVITGKNDGVMRARKRVVQQLQTQASVS